jgi:hypothetical protein|tara:strand:- start:1453 stop:1731 length:279 start_codon:yes stop_codon:yes gene_type:complete
LKRKATEKEKKYMGRVAEMNCMLCNTHPVEVHHIREGQGMSQRASHYLTVPLCPSCHRGPVGVHGDKAMMKVQKIDELDMLAMTIAALNDGR